MRPDREILRERKRVESDIWIEADRARYYLMIKVGDDPPFEWASVARAWLHRVAEKQ